MFQSIQVTFVIFVLRVAIIFVVRIGHFLVVIIAELLFPRGSFLHGRCSTNIHLLGYYRRRKKRSNNRRVLVLCIMLPSLLSSHFRAADPNTPQPTGHSSESISAGPPSIPSVQKRNTFSTSTMTQMLPSL